ncbi:uncharacterized protein JN550_008409 [Neoarthrinium moseri]|uniref:uncharacterized protein n=1 Tax=Neoarthrinium moseri TaxID=1658444 RepID=UPI001FDD1428|nr:uncharacterized protein JN550_008409 [Neoarthrinium moseri]KAI1865361.1 hypothetical protein JN550_008409 [Neoarthrinium moseri]
MDKAVAPGEQILRAFGLNGVPEPLAGGMGLCFRIGNVVLKPTDDKHEAQGVSELTAHLLSNVSSEYRLSRPIPIIRDAAKYVHSGWTASTFLEGSSGSKPRIAETLSVSRAFHRDLAMAYFKKPRFVDERINRWSESDRVTWGEKALEDVDNVDFVILEILNPTLEQLKEMMEPLPRDLESQLMHADLAGNVLFDDQSGLAPAIIDLTMYWRPAAYAEAIMVVDGIMWHGEGKELIELCGTGQVWIQLLIRALYWREITFAIDPDEQFISANFGRVDFQEAVNALRRCIPSM